MATSSLVRDLDALVRWEAGPAAAPVALPKSRLKELRALGHKIERFLAARAPFSKHVVDTMPGWAQQPGGTAPGELTGEGLFACAVSVSESGLKLLSSVLPQGLASRLVSLWQRHDPDAPRTVPAALAIPADADAPAWFALLRLRPFRDLWERELRRATFEALLEVLPDAWPLDPTPLPPGAVIPRLDLAAWTDLVPRRAPQRAFAIAPSHTMESAVVLDAARSEDEWTRAMEGALARPPAPRVLIELPTREDSSPVVIAFYERGAGRVDHLGALALASDGKEGLTPARVVAG